MKRLLKAADLFCGAGGTSTGLLEACRNAGYECELTAVNHWDVAVATHSANHPTARHLCESLDAVNPRQLFKEGELDLLWASPECMHHSIARGGRPINDQSRATAWHVIRWADLLRPKVILVENVKEFETWGGIGANGRPLKKQRGKTFAAWVAALESIGYRVDWRVLCAADYGDPTTRERLFVQAVCGRRKITWPEPTHAPASDEDLLGARQAWRTAKDHVIDWSLPPGRSVFDRDPPIAENTLRRVLTGYERFGNEPFMIPQHRGWDGNLVDSISRPLRTVTAGARGVALCTPFLLTIDHTGGNGNCVNSINKPLTSVTTKARHCLVKPYFVRYNGSSDAESIDKPLSTITTRDRMGLVMPIRKRGRSKRKVDFLLRMLQPHELAAAQGFPKGYVFTGNKTEAVKQIGNAVPIGLSKALVSAVLGQL